jgi:hypothetical protein
MSWKVWFGCAIWWMLWAVYQIVYGHIWWALGMDIAWTVFYLVIAYRAKNRVKAG